MHHSGFTTQPTDPRSPGVLLSRGTAEGRSPDAGGSAQPTDLRATEWIPLARKEREAFPLACPPWKGDASKWRIPLAHGRETPENGRPPIRGSSTYYVARPHPDEIRSAGYPPRSCRFARSLWSGPPGCAGNVRIFLAAADRCVPRPHVLRCLLDSSTGGGPPVARSRLCRVADDGPHPGHRRIHSHDRSRHRDRHCGVQLRREAANAVTGGVRGSRQRSPRIGVQRRRQGWCPVPATSPTVATVPHPGRPFP